MHHNVVHVHQQVNCCCCSARTGLRVLGVWWIICCILNIFNLFVPYVWPLALVNILSLLPPFISFCKMTHHHDSPHSRHDLYKNYRNWAIYFGLPAMFGVYVYLCFAAVDFINYYCDIVGVNCAGTTSAAGVLLIYCIIDVAIYAAFRFYFLSVMKRYHEEGEFLHNNGAVGVVTTVVQYAPVQPVAPIYAPQQQPFVAPTYP